MRGVLRILSSIIIILILGLIGYLNHGLYYTPSFSNIGNSQVNYDLLRQLRYLKGKMHHGAGDQMQQLYPEGFVFINSIYGLSWIELAGHMPKTTPLFHEANQEINWAVKEINSPKAKAIFQEDLTLPNGAFFTGWSTYLSGRKLLLVDRSVRDPKDVAFFKAACIRISKALINNPNPYLESYEGAAWPADGVICVAALALHDRIFPPAYQSVIKQWVGKAQQHQDASGLIPHQVDAISGDVLEPARGSSQSLILTFLQEIDSIYAQKQFLIYKAHFLDSRLGLPGVREFPKDKPGQADIDSGPLIWQIGGAASIVGRRVMQQYGETTLAIGLRNSIETFGISASGQDEKKYLLGWLPIADAFITWGNSLEAEKSISSSENWQKRFQLISLTVALPLILMLGWLWKKNSKE